MKINGVELNFSLYDSANSEMKQRYFEELRNMETIRQEIPEGTEGQQIDYLCGRIKVIFDNVFGQGTGAKVCGEGNNLLTCMGAYEQLVSEQIRQNEEYESIMNRIKERTGQVLNNESLAGKIS